MIELLIEAERALNHGRLDEADRLYRQVADHDPRNAIATVGLARVALDRGDDLGAYLHARRALSIDPENPTARHLVMRMTEVLAGRGEMPAGAAPVPAPAAPPPEPTATQPPDGPPEPPASSGPPPPKPGLIGRLMGRRRRS